jgi:hypothetical protein
MLYEYTFYVSTDLHVEAASQAEADAKIKAMADRLDKEKITVPFDDGFFVVLSSVPDEADMPSTTAN